jgi:hypothetical protein
MLASCILLLFLCTMMLLSLCALSPLDVSKLYFVFICATTTRCISLISMLDVFFLQCTLHDQVGSGMIYLVAQFYPPPPNYLCVMLEEGFCFCALPP